MIDTQESMTAKLCSFARAYHSNYEKEKIFDDYLAYDLMGKEEYEEIGQLIEHGFQKERFDPAYSFSGKDISDVLNTFISPIPLSRASFAERELWRFAYDRGECQYVICGAGMDTFAFRNVDPKIKVFEIDHPDTQRYKLKRIRELEWNIPKKVKYVSVDFTSDHMGNELRKAGFDPKMPSFFAILGVSYYLSLSVFEETIRTIGQSSSFASKLLFDFPDDTTFGAETAERVKILTEITAGLGEPMRHGYTVEEISDALHRHGYLIDDHETPEKIQKRFFAGRTDKQRAYENIHFILAKKADDSNEIDNYYI